MFRLLLLFLLMPNILFASPPSRVSSYTSGTAISSTAVTANEDSLFSWGQTVDAYFDNGLLKNANLAQITTASKVSGAALTSLASIPSGAGVIPSANLPASASVSVKVGSFTRDTSLASGTQAITGVGFQPKGVIFLGGQGTGTEASFGMSDASSNGALYQRTGSNFIDTSDAIFLNEVNGVDTYGGDVTSFDSDGFTLTWTKTGSPTGTVTVYYFAIK